MRQRNHKFQDILDKIKRPCHIKKKNILFDVTISIVLLGIELLSKLWKVLVFTRKKVK